MTSPSSSDQSGRVNEQSSLVVVANRLPFDFEVLPDGSTKVHQSPGGLVTALEPILSRQHGAWIGWPGTPDLELDPITEHGLNLEPVSLTAEEVSRYYEGFSNATLWPLYHDAVAESEYHREWWESYQQVNRKFAEAAARTAAPDATVWVHDYQLQLVPQMLRELRPDVRIGFFLHIPFPPAELFNRLPWRKQIITGLLGADLIGFQLAGGARNFARLARQLLGAEHKGSKIHFEGRAIRIGSFPISIDSAGLSALAATPEVHTDANTLRAGLGNPRKIILGVDRLDYTKGINVRLQAFAELLAEGDPSVDGAVMVQIATPSRERLESYIKMREGIERQVGAINGNYGRIGSPAVHYLHQSLPREQLSAFYSAADVMTVTPLRDGMNLVAKEYVASRVDGGGALLLSEFTGAAKELKAALMVNPYDTDGVKEGLRQALNMPELEARRRMRILRRQVLTHDVDRWAERFLSVLGETRETLRPKTSHLPDEVVAALTEISSTSRLLIGVDFDGTLAPMVDDPSLARPLAPSMVALHAMSTLPGTEVAVISGRAMADLPGLLVDAEDSAEQTAKFHLVGSHGGEGAGVVAVLDQAGRTRLAEMTRTLQQIVSEFPKVHLEIKPAGVAVHLRQAAAADAAQVSEIIENGPASWRGVHVLRGKMVVELTVISTNKGQALDSLRRSLHASAVLFIGDDITDENAFAVLHDGDLGIKVGNGDTAAMLRIGDPEAVSEALALLNMLRRNAVVLSAGVAAGHEEG